MHFELGFFFVFFLCALFLPLSLLYAFGSVVGSPDFFRRFGFRTGQGSHWPLPFCLGRLHLELFVRPPFSWY